MKSTGNLLFFVLAFINLRLAAQEKLGISNSNYSGTNSIFLNPSSSVDSKTYMQLNLAGANAYAMTNVAYLKDFWLYGHAKNEPFLQNIMLSTKQVPKFAYATATIDGPSFVISKRNYGAGVFVRARSVADARAGSFLALASATVQDLDNASNTYVNLNNTRAGAMTWLEYGANFGLMVKRDRNTLISVGASLRYVSGINLMYANMTTLRGYYNDSMINVDDMSGKIRFTDFALNSGKGLGADVGITYKKMLGNVKNYFSNSVRCNCQNIDYKYKVGLILRDLGYIRFKNNTSSADVSGSGSYFTDRGDTSYKAAVQGLLNTEFSAKPILAALPTALVGQFDWNFENNFYINATVIKNAVPNSFTGVRGSNLISIAPRYETQNFEVAVPLTFQKFMYPQLGVAMRYRTFVLGVDNVFPFLLSKNTYGLNAYFSLGISLFKNPACRKKVRKVDVCPKGRNW